MDFLNSIQKNFFFLVSENDSVLEIIGNPGSFFQINLGHVDNKLDVLLREEVKPYIIELINEFKKNPSDYWKTCIYPIEWDEKIHYYQFRIYPISKLNKIKLKNPLPQKNHPAYGIHVIELDWEDFTYIHTFSHDSNYNEESKLKIKYLENLLHSREESLNSYIEELKITNKKYKILIEELDRASKNYQILNEQLETSNEELRVSNEELQNAYAEVTTLNKQLEVKEEELKRKEETLRAMVDNVPGVIFSALFANPNNFLFSYVSPKIEKEFRIPLHRAYEFGDRALPIHPEDEGYVRRCIYKAYHTGEPLHLEGRFLYPDDSVEYWECFASVTKKDDSFVIMDGVLLNKTKEVLQEQYAKNLQKEFQDTVEQAIGVVYKLQRRDDGEFVYVFIDGFIAKSLGITKELVSGKTLKEVYDEEQANILRNQCEIAFQSGPYETEIKFKDRYYYSRTFPYYENGIKVGVIGSAVDITEKKYLESKLFQTQKLETLGILASGIAHDLNNMLQPIIIYSKMLGESLQSMVPASELEKIQKIISASEKAKRLVSQILDFSRKQGSKKEKIEPLDLFQSLQENLNLLLIDLPSHIKLEKEINLPKNAKVYLHEEKFTQLLMNLISNAIDSMKKNVNGKLSICAYPITKLPEDWKSELEPSSQIGYIISIEDNGKGMDEEKLQNIFEPFFTDKSKGEGLGLGLSIVKGIISEVGGSIMVKSKVGKGTTFYVYLPEFNSQKESMRSTTHETTNETIKNLTLEKSQEKQEDKKKIIIIDDDDFTREAIEDLLMLKKYSYVSFKCPKEGIEFIQNAKSDEEFILITDYKMPEMTGVELIETIRKSHPQLPTILYTGNALPISNEFLKNNQVDLLEKPIDPETLLQNIQNLMKKKE